MRPPLVIRTDRSYWKRILWISVFVAPFVALGVAVAIKNIRNGNRDNMGTYMLLVSAFMAMAPGFLLLARRRWVERIDERGVTLRNGRTFLWSSFVRAEPRRHHKMRMTNNYDLVFRDGTAGVYHLMAENYDEVMDVVKALESGTNPFTN